YVVVPENCIRVIPAAIGNDAGGILEAVACPAGAVYRVGLKPDDVVLIQGAGVAGLAFAQTAKAFGSRKVIVTVRNETRHAFAKRFGADVVIDTSKETLEQRVMEETEGRGADLSIDAAGAPATVEAAVRLARKGGSVILYGIPDDAAQIRFPVKEIILNQITLYGLTNNELVWDPLIDMVARGVVNVRDMVTHRFALRELDQAVELLKRHPADLIKAVVHPWED
ncbi:MAG: zinc-binding dehydrogenase, partial [Eubacteriales bacterium]|nr:zinc-binding dehydrogenase [Eubacteriales bacterium]